MSCGFERVSGAPTPSEHIESFLATRDGLRGERIARGGTEVCAALSVAMDVVLDRLFRDVDSTNDVAVVATGGYGRAELSPFSDVDVMVLHDTKDPAEAAASLFRPLWDAGLRLGHAVRTVKEAATAARETVETHTTLLTTRLVAGSEDLYARFAAEITSVTKARPLTRHLVSEERRKREAVPYLLMAANVKSGRGGLRTLQGFQWERRREELIGRFTPRSTREEETAHDSLLRIRNALHVVTGRPHDVFSSDLREPVARWLGLDAYEVGELLVAAMLTVDRLATERWPELIETPPTAKRWGRDRRGAQPESAADLTADRFVAMLRSGEQGRFTIDRIYEGGHLADLLPDWGTIRTAPQLAPFHEHPVEAHLWRTISEMKNLIDGDSHYSAIAAEIDSDSGLILSAFLHDIGKGQGGDHSILGSEIAASFCVRLGCEPEIVSLVSDAVHHHLLLSQTATRRDLDDPAVIDDVVETVDGLRLLQTLYLLTVADSIATGPTMWNTWKQTLVRTLFLRCAARIGADKPPRDVIEQLVVDTGPTRRRAGMESHLAAMPDEYVRSVNVDDVSWHLDLIKALSGDAGLGVREGEGAQTAVVVGAGQPGFRRRVAESFAANGIDVLEARMHSREDGIIVDIFQVRDDVTGAPVSETKWGRARADLVAAVSGDLDTGSKVAERAAAYSSRESNGLDLEVSISLDNATGDTVITVKCADRIGRLAKILDALFSSGLEIRLAKLDSRGGQVVDTFHVEGGAELNPAVLEDRIVAAIEA